MKKPTNEKFASLAKITERWESSKIYRRSPCRTDMSNVLNLIKSGMLLTQNEIMNFNIGGEKMQDCIKTQKKRLQNLCKRPIPGSNHDKLEYLYFITENC